MKEQKSVSPKDAFLRLCKIQKLSPVSIEVESGIGIAIDRAGNPYANLHLIYPLKNTWRFTKPTRPQPLVPIPKSLSLRLYRDMITKGDSVDTEPKPFRYWMICLTRFIRQSEFMPQY